MHVKCTFSCAFSSVLLLGYHKYLSITTFPQDPQELKALRSDVLRPLIDVILRYLNLLTVVHVAAETHLMHCVNTYFSPIQLRNHTYNRRHIEHLQLKSRALIHDVIELSLEGKVGNTT